MADKLQARGIPEREIAFIQDYDSDASNLCHAHDDAAAFSNQLSANHLSR